MTNARQLVASAHIRPAELYEMLVGDDPHGFWLTQHGNGETISRLGVGTPDTDVLTGRRAQQVHADAIAPESSGGWIGWLGYEADQSSWLRVDRYVSFEHSTCRVWALAPDDVIDSWANEVRAALLAPAWTSADAVVGTLSPARARHSPDEYRSMIESALDEIRAGDAYQLCLTTRFSMDGPVDPRTVHARLAQAQAPYTAMIRSGSRALVASSPEQFLQLSASGILSSSPIKGTRPRGSGTSDDARLAGELKNDAKEQAENLMIVDLMRNDLSRVCEAGSVEVARLFDVETHAHVHQLVSQVTGRVDRLRTTADIVDAAFPAGSMTGAPKSRAMQILAGLERGPRGAYSGCFGWIGDDGTMDLAMTIRSAVIDENEAYVGAGGGLTIDSRPEFEVDEVVVKARAPLAALGACVPEEWERGPRRL